MQEIFLEIHIQNAVILIQHMSWFKILLIGVKTHLFNSAIQLKRLVGQMNCLPFLFNGYSYVKLLHVFFNLLESGKGFEGNV